MTKTLADGEALDGSKHNYTLTFPAGQLPPVNAFWSVTMYDGKTQVADREPDQPLPDQFADAAGHEEKRGRLTDAYIQKRSPGADKESNWLPAPNGDDLPRDAAVLAEDRSAVGPAAGKGTWQPPAIVAAK